MGKNKRQKQADDDDDGGLDMGGFGDLMGWGDIPEEEEEEEEEEDDEDDEEDWAPPPPPPPPPPGKGGRGGKNQPNNAGKGQAQQKNQKQNQNQQWGNNGWDQHGGGGGQLRQQQQQQQQQQRAFNGSGPKGKNGQDPNQNETKNKNNNNKNNAKNNKNNKNNKKGDPRMEDVEEEEVGGWGSTADWFNGGTGADWGKPAETASGIGFGAGTATGTGVGPGSMAGWGRQTATNSEWGAAPQQSFRRQQDQLASLLNHPRVWTPSAGIPEDRRTQSHVSAPQSSAPPNSFAHHQQPQGPHFAASPPAPANSRTFRHATASSASILDGGARNGPHTQVQILDSGGAALEAADKALFGHERLANQRIHWMFSPYKDQRVSSLMEWIQAMNHALATVGVHHLLQTQQRGALFTNADFRHWQFTSEPTFDWMTFDDVVDSYDKTLQESIAFYEVENQVLVFIFLLSPSKNSMAVWRRKIAIPNAVRTQNRGELTKVGKLLSKRKFVLTVDNIPKKHVGPSEPPKPKRKWFNILR